MFAAMKIARILSMLLFLALLLAPLRMVRGEATAMPHHGPAMAMEHCAPDADPDEGQPLSKANCMMACAALPAVPALLAERLALTGGADRPLPVREIQGLAPEAATPPPRMA